MTTQDFLHDLWKWKCGLDETAQEKATQLEIDELRLSEWDNEFETLMRNRLIFGAFRYGRIRAKGKVEYDRTASMIKRIHKYVETGNKEYLVDVANLCMLEYVECHHPNAHFSSVDDGEHVKPIMPPVPLPPLMHIQV